MTGPRSCRFSFTASSRAESGSSLPIAIRAASTKSGDGRSMSDRLLDKASTDGGLTIKRIGLTGFDSPPVPSLGSNEWAFYLSSSSLSRFLS